LKQKWQIFSGNFAKSSRQEPGGLSACRVHIKIATDAHRGVGPISDEFSNNCETCQLGTVDLSVNQKIATFEMFVYLFPAKSLFSRLRSFLSKIAPLILLVEQKILFWLKESCSDHTITRKHLYLLRITLSVGL